MDTSSGTPKNRGVQVVSWSDQESGQNKTNHYHDINAVSKESPPQEMPAVTNSPGPLSWVFGKKHDAWNYWKGNKNMGNCFNIQEKIPQHILPLQELDNSQSTLLISDEVIFKNPPDELLQHHNLSCQPDVLPRSVRDVSVWRVIGW